MTSPQAIERELAALRGEVGGEHGGVRTSIVDLIVHARDEAVAAAAVAMIQALEHSRPSRCIVTVGSARRTSVEAMSTVVCQTPLSGAAHAGLICSDIVRLDGPADGGALASMARALLLPDLPVFLLWWDEPSFEGAAYRALAGVATRVVTDSTQRPETLDRLMPLLRRRGPVATDLAWARVTPWRSALAQVFDHPDHLPALAGLRAIRVHHRAGSDAEARLVGGWLRARGRRAATVEIVAEERSDVRVGSIVRIELSAPEGEFSVERFDRATARVVTPMLPDRLLTLHTADQAELVGAELDVLHPDRAFDEALRMAAEPAR